jgi:group I intron endonuclease
MQNDDKSGIYCIENKVTNKKYIGQSVNINYRWSKHRYELNNNAHYNDYLQNAWNKYGEDKFVFYVLECCCKEELDEKEKYYIALYNTTDRNYGYNLQSGGQASNTPSYETCQKISASNKKAYLNSDLREKRSIDAYIQWSNPNIKEKITGKNNGMYGKHHTEAARKKMSEKKKGKPSPHRIMIPVLCIETNEYFDCAAEAAHKFSVQSGSILGVCRGERKTCGGYHWKFLLENNTN